MILESVENSLLIWPTVEENEVTTTKKYAKLSATKKIQTDCDMKATNIILQGLPADIYSLVNHHRLHAYLEQHELHANEVRFVVHVFSPGDDPIAFLNKAMAFLTAVASLSNVTSSGGNNASGQTVIQRVPHSEPILIDMENQSICHELLLKPLAVDFTDNEIHSDSNIIPYSQYLQETQQANVQDTHLQAQQDSMILSMIEQMLGNKVINASRIIRKQSNKEQKNESVTR
ncbi:hypothetical protein Tco_0856570 [Tanacetum coccineum]|uniref:Uncharacterized protein n=1 Tax=Tanacetum coccineum TaxID=301880 RepID=A0ABQ5B7N1_9ASTR